MKHSTHIPPANREAVYHRDHWTCQRCGNSATDWHHRRSRRVVDSHQHCPCNGVMLCRTCHSWVHANPILATASGLIVSSYSRFPGSVPYEAWNGVLWMLRCDGDVVVNLN